MGRFERIDKRYTPDDLQNFAPGCLAVIIPAHNSEKRIGMVISNLCVQPMPKGVDLEVVVCANACVDRTAEAAEKALDRLRRKRPGARTKLIVTSTPGEPQALNTMIEYLGEEREVVVGLNDDCFPTMGALACLGAAAMDNDRLGVVGVVPKPLPTYRGRSGKLAERIAVVDIELSRSGRELVVGRMYAFRPKIIGKFPNVMSEDGYMVWRSLTNHMSDGYGVIDESVAAVYHRVPTSFEDLLKQRRIYAMGKRQIIREYPDFRELVLRARGESGRWFVRPENYLRAEGDFSIFERIMALGVAAYGKIASLVEDKVRPAQSSLRERVASAI